MASGPRIAVFGDIMLDNNVYVSITKIASEAPIPVFHCEKEEYHLGGAGNVIKNLAALGCSNITAFGFIGDDMNGKIVTELLTTSGATTCVDVVPNYPTVTKKRYFCENKIVFRADVGKAVTIDDTDLCSRITNVLTTQRFDCVVLSDYNQGFLTKERCQLIIRLCTQNGIPTVVDPRNDFTKYVGCTLIKPNRKEAYQLFSIPSSTPIQEVHAIIRSRIGCKYSVVTLAEDGISVGTDHSFYTTTTVAQHTVDVTGAGDIVTTIFAYFIERSMSLHAIADLATKVATKSVGCPGTYTLQKRDIHTFKKGLIDRSELAVLKELHSDKKIVFTNGCFDLLHSGHIEVLKFCKERGDIVIVGLNSDASVRRLKGPTRPINNERVRADLLSSMSYVDYVVLFEEDTPLQLLKELKPYYFVKGGDYKAETLEGREHATETLVCNFVEGLSTTNTVKKIQSQ